MKNFLLLLTFVTAFFLMSCSTGDETKMYDVKVSVSPSEAGSISPSADSTYEEGQKISLRANPIESHTFSSWSGDIDTTDNPLSLTVDQNYTITANFDKKSYELSINTEGEGTVNEEIVQTKSKDYEHGTVVKLTANPSEGWIFSEWRGDISRTENPTQIIVDSKTDINTIFEPASTNVTVSADWNELGNVPEEIFSGDQSNLNSSSGNNKTVAHFGVRIEYLTNDNAVSQSAENTNQTSTANISFNDISTSDSVRISAIAVNETHAIKLGVIEITNLNTSTSYEFTANDFQWFAPSWGTAPEFAESGWDTARVSKSVDKADIVFDVVNPFDPSDRTNYADFIMRLNGTGGIEEYKGDYIREYRTVVDHPNQGTVDTVVTSYEWHPYIDETMFDLPNSSYIVDLRSSFVVIFE